MGLFTSALRFPATRGGATRPAAQSANRSAATTDANHLFANNVRFLSMVAIIAVHTLGSYPYSSPAQRYLEQPFKFGTIAFFLVAGFLFGERIDRYSSLQYYARRLKNVFLPWSVWYLLYTALLVGADFIHGRIGFASTSLLRQVGHRFSFALLDTAYWFVPNLLIALAILLVFRRVLKDIRVGLAFLVVSLFYAINIYTHWVPVQHTRAVFGFVFYLWLGAWGAWHFAAVEKWLARVPVSVIIGLVLLTNGLALAESRLLFTFHSVDTLNSLRITNQLSSVVTTLAIVRLRRSVWPRFMDVRAHTFGLYLSHTVGLAVLGAILVRLLPRLAPLPFWTSVPANAVLLPAIFITTYGGSLLLVRSLLSNSWLRWTVGLSGKTRAGAPGCGVPAGAAAANAIATRSVPQKANSQVIPNPNPRPVHL